MYGEPFQWNLDGPTPVWNTISVLDQSWREFQVAGEYIRGGRATKSGNNAIMNPNLASCPHCDVEFTVTWPNLALGETMLCGRGHRLQISLFSPPQLS